jgi:putative ABC transport system permease protein
MRLYRRLLRLYPASFRADYADEMADIFHERLRQARGLARAMLWLEAIQETVMNAPAAHIEMLSHDVGAALRTLVRARGFALTAIAIVALGVGANTAAFTVTDFVLLRPLPFHEPDRLVTIWQTAPGYATMELSPANIDDWKRAATSFERVGVYRRYGANLVGPGEPQRVTGWAVSADLLPTLGVSAALGRVFADGEDGERAERTVIVSDRLWRGTFGADPEVIGRIIVLDDHAHTVIGVMPPGFVFPSRDTELWVPLVISGKAALDRTNNELYAVARLAAGVTLDAARSEMTIIAAQSRQQYPKENEFTGAVVNRLHDELLAGQPRATLWALNGAAACVLLIVCANLANLLLARAIARRREIAVRTAMGAGRERLIRQLATESAILAALGGVAGVVVAWAAVPLLFRLVPAVLPTDAVPQIDVPVLAFAAVLTFVTAIGFGVAPLLRTRTLADLGALREGARAVGGPTDRLRSALVVGEVIASVVLLIAAGLLVRALWTIQSRDPGFRPEGVLTVRNDLLFSKYLTVSSRADFYNRVLDEVRALPGVTHAAYGSGLPMVWGGGIWPVGIRGEELERRGNNTASLRYVTPGFFATLGIPMRRGRDVGESDTTTTPFVAVVSESLVERYWPGESGLDRQFTFGGQERIVVGVVGNVRVRGLERDDTEPQVYLPYRQVADRFFLGYMPRELVVRASTPPADLIPGIRTILRRADPQLPVSTVRTMSEVVDLQTVSRTAQVRVLAGFAFVACLLAAIGIHGVLSLAVSQRTAEIGVRIALGAQRRDILSMVTGQGLRLVVAGLVPGLVLAYLAGRMLQALLVGVTPADAPTFATVIGLTLLMAAAGTLLPTLRAVNVDAVKAMRAE